MQGHLSLCVHPSDRQLDGHHTKETPAYIKVQTHACTTFVRTSGRGENHHLLLT